MVERHRSDQTEDGMTEDDQEIESSPMGKNFKLSFYDGFALLVSMQVGSGIFSSPSQVHNHVPSPGAALLIWMISGLIAWIGAASFAELGTAIPVNGGMQEYLHYIYGDFISFLVSWIWILAVKPSCMAILSIIFAEYWTNAVIPNFSNAWAINTALSIGALAIIVLFNCMSVNSTSRLTNIFFAWKLMTVALLLLCCFLVLMLNLHGDGGKVSHDWKLRNWFAIMDNNPDEYWGSCNTWEMLGQYTTALYAGLWAYSGWDCANVVAGEMQNPSRDLPKAIHTALPTVITCFMLANLSYYFVIPWQQIGTSNTVAVLVGQKAFGALGGALFAILVSMACLGSLNINVYTAGRLSIAAAKLGYLPHWFTDIGFGSARNSQENQLLLMQGNAPINRDINLWMTPIKAILFNASITCIYILIGSFRALIVFVGIAEFFFFFLTVLGLLILRVTQPSLPRPYRPAFWMPVLFTLISLLLVIRGMMAAPVQATVLGSLLFTGCLYHYIKPCFMAFLRRESSRPDENYKPRK